jgi:hypothetical protein
MRSRLLFALAAALVAALVIVAPSTSHAATCEAALRSKYRCSATFDDGSSSEYCLETDLLVPDDGRFLFYEDVAGFACTCAPRGKAPGVKFGASAAFICGSARAAMSGKVSGSRITGQAVDTRHSNGVRSTFTCRAVDSCP